MVQNVFCSILMMKKVYYFYINHSHEWQCCIGTQYASVYVFVKEIRKVEQFSCISMCSINLLNIADKNLNA